MKHFFEVNMAFCEVDFLSNTFLFKNVSKDKIEVILQSVKPELISYEKGATIFSPDCYDKKVGFIASGECIIERLRQDGSFIPLNIVRKYDSFGIMAALSSEEEFPTAVVAKTAAKVLFISQDSLISLLKRYPSISMNVISFLADRIAFLNKKITTFSSDSVSKKLALYLIQKHKECGAVEFAFSFKKASDNLGCGRASVYRAAGSLSESGVISIENKIIKIQDFCELERISK